MRTSAAKDCTAAAAMKQKELRDLMYFPTRSENEFCIVMFVQKFENVSFSNLGTKSGCRSQLAM